MKKAAGETLLCISNIAKDHSCLCGLQEVIKHEER